jgi:predicted flap endonuclease-1-like 5' DNA nuclease
MPADMSASLPLILIGLALLVLAAWLLMRLNRKATVIEDGSAPALARDVLDEGAERARRNQALIDAAPAAVKPDPAPAPAPEPTPAAEAAPLAEVVPVAAPVVETTPAMTPAPAAPTTANDLTRIKGVGPKLVALLADLGVTTFAQIAAWSDADVERVDAQLGRFKGRITRDQWIEQAKLLSAGDEAGFADKFGRNG